MPGPSLIGLTGGIAAGKSEVLTILAELGAETLSTDAIVHSLLAEDEEIRTLLVDRWGAEMETEGRLDRSKIASHVFGRPEELAWLEAVLHPRVGERVQRWRRSLPDDLAVAVVEVPLLFEGGMAEGFDATIAVVAGEEARAARAAERGTAQLEGRSSRQLSQEQKAERATHVIHNDGSLEELRAAVLRVFPELEEAASG